jgi:hypothetical protein
VPPSPLVVLVVLPVTIWASLAYVHGSSSKLASRMRALRDASAKSRIPDRARFWTLFNFSTFAIVLGGVLLWIKMHPWMAAETVSGPKNFARGIFHGGIWGLALVGFVPLVYRYFPPAKKFGFLIMGGSGLPPWVSVSILVFVAFTEELWRSISLKEVTGSGSSAPEALVLTSLAYAVAYLAWGYRVGIADGIMGAIYGGLYLWSGSLFVPLAAHIIFQGYYLSFAIVAVPSPESEGLYERPTTKCPACATNLRWRQLDFDTSGVSFCPSCNTRVATSTWRRGFFRWGFVFVFLGFLGAALDIFPGAEHGRVGQSWLSMFVAFGATAGFFNFVGGVLPPKLECVGAYFVPSKPDDGNEAPQDARKNDEVSGIDK